MTKDEAWRVIDACKNWNTSETSVDLAMRGQRTVADDALDEKRRTLAEAWRTVREQSA